MSKMPEPQGSQGGWDRLAGLAKAEIEHAVKMGRADSRLRLTLAISIAEITNQIAAVAGNGALTERDRRDQLSMLCAQQKTYAQPFIQSIQSDPSAMARLRGYAEPNKGAGVLARGLRDAFGSINLNRIEQSPPVQKPKTRITQDFSM